MPAAKLSEAQKGWYLILDKNKSWKNDDIHWNKEWIVFANRNDDAIYFDKNDGRIHGCIDKKLFFVLAESLDQFFKIISRCMKIESKFNFETRNNDEEVSDEFLTSIQDELNTLTTDEVTKDFMNFFFE